MRVFLSHSTKDRFFVEKLEGTLRGESVDPWLCEVDIDYGHNFVAKIEEGLREADLTLLIFSPEAARSAWTEVEWTSVLAREVSESRTRLGILVLRDCEIPELLRTKHRIDARKDAESGIREAVAWVKRMRDMRRIAGTNASHFYIDYDPADFVGRGEYLERLFEALVEQPGKFLLYGGPGSGKSMLARKFSWEAQGAFDVVAFQICGQRPVAEITVELAERLKLDLKERPPEEQMEIAKDWLAGRRSLLVLDDLWNEDILELIPRPPVSVLITSRRRSVPRLSPEDTLEVLRFVEEEVEGVFEIYLGSETTERHRMALLELAERFERLPIAVAVAADLLRRELDPLEEAAYGVTLERLQSAVHDVPELLSRAIEAQPENARRLLEAMAICTPESVWLPLAGDIAGLEEPESKKARNRLVDSSLLRVADRERQRFRLHALLHEQARVCAAIDELEEQRARALERLFGSWRERWKECRECLAEIALAVTYLWKNDELDRMATLGYRTYAVAQRIGELEMALRIEEHMESFWRRRGDRIAKDGLQASYGNQALILKAWGRLEEAMELHKKEEAICLELGNKVGLAYGYWNWGLLARELMDTEGGREKLEAVLTIFIELDMPEADAVKGDLRPQDKSSMPE